MQWKDPKIKVGIKSIGARHDCNENKSIGANHAIMKTGPWVNFATFSVINWASQQSGLNLDISESRLTHKQVGDPRASKILQINMMQ